MTSPVPFEGNKDENYALFEHQLKAAIQIHRIPPTEQVAVLFLKLAGKAQKFFISLQQHQKGDFDTATWHLRNRYQNPNRAWMHSAAFKNRMWQQDVESVEDYVLELKTLAAIAFETEAEQTIQVRAQFQVGIPTYLKRKIITHTHETLAQWVERISMQIAINDACGTNTDNYGSQFHTIQPAPAQTTTDPNLYRLLSVIQADQQKHEKITKNATDKIENLQHSIASNHNPNGPQTYRPPQFAEQTQNSNANAPHAPAPWELLPPEIQNMRISREQQQNAHATATMPSGDSWT